MKDIRKLGMGWQMAIHVHFKTKKAELASGQWERSDR